MAIVKDEIDFIDEATKKVHYVSGKVEPLSYKAEINLFGTPHTKATIKGVKEAEIKFHEGVGEFTGSTATNTFLKNLSGSFGGNLLTGGIVDPVIAGYSALTPGEGQEDQGFFSRAVENYFAQRQGRREARSIIDAENPNAAFLGKVGSLGLDLAMPLPKKIQQSPTATGALFGAGASEQSVFEDPAGVAKNTALGGGLGFAIGKGVGALSKVAQERKLLRDFPKLEKESEIAYQQRLQNFRSTTGRKLEGLKRDLGKLGIEREALAIEEFVNREIGVSPLAGTQEGAKIEKFFTTLGESLPETMHTEDIQRLYEALELRAALQVEAELPLIQKFKEHLSETLPFGAVKNQLMGKVFPKVERETSKVIDQLFDSLPANVVKEAEKSFGTGIVSRMKVDLKKALKEKFGSMTTEEFVDTLTSGDASPFLESLNDSPVFNNLTNLVEYDAASARRFHKTALPDVVASRSAHEAQTRFQNIANQLESRVEGILQNNGIDASILVDKVHKKVTGRISDATGVQNPLTAKAPSNAPVGRYVPLQAPQTGAMAKRFESKPLNMGGKAAGAFGLGALGKLFGVPKIGAVIGGAKAVKAGMEGTLRGLTSPGALGNMAREGMQGGGLRILVEQISSTYPSYERGVLQDPEERKHAVATIESNPDVILEDKAILQAYINRGKSLENLIR